MEKGKLVVLYGINNTGKTTQCNLLIDRLRREGKNAEYIKYLIYDLPPSGPMINDYFRGGNPHDLNPREFQLLGTINKYHYQPILEQKLAAGIYMIAEDYWASSVAWGVAAEAAKDFLIKVNEGIRREDVVFLLDGDRFLEALEQNHRHEKDFELVKKARNVYQELAREYNWHIVNANDSIVNIHTKIWEEVKKII